jgi:hypothetical protein
MSIFEATPDEQRDHMLRHTVKAKDVPVGMTFYTSYDDYNFNIESGERVMNEALYYTYTGYGFDSDAPIDPETNVYVSKPELCGVAVVPDSPADAPGKIHDIKRSIMNVPETDTELEFDLWEVNGVLHIFLDNKENGDSMGFEFTPERERELYEILRKRQEV